MALIDIFKNEVECEKCRVTHPSSKEKNEKFVWEMKSLMPLPDTQCNCCENVAFFTWCSSEIFNNDPYLWEVNKVNKLEFTYLCKECLIREYKRKIEEENIEME